MSIPTIKPLVRTSRGDLRRKAIIDIARATFLGDGYATASMSAIAAKAGGSKATLYSYFPSKADLFAAVIHEMCDRSRHELLQAGERIDDVTELLAMLGRRYLRIVLSGEMIALHRLVVSECVRFPEVGEALYAVGPRYGKAAVANALARFAAQGELRMAEPERAAGHFLDLCQSGLYRRRLWNVTVDPSDDEIDENVDAAVRVFLRGYATPA